MVRVAFVTYRQWYEARQLLIPSVRGLR